MGLGREIFITNSADGAGVGAKRVLRRISPNRPNNSFFIKHLLKKISNYEIRKLNLTKLASHFKENPPNEENNDELAMDS
jgi:hypothetical protein